MGINFKFNETASIDHLNIRKEGAEREILAVDIKVIGEAPGHIVRDILGCTKKACAYFWIEGDLQHPAFNGIKMIDTQTEFDQCEVVIADRKFVDAKVRRISLLPIIGGDVKLSCQITLTDIDEKTTGFICDKIRALVPVSIGSQPDIFD